MSVRLGVIGGAIIAAAAFAAACESIHPCLSRCTDARDQPDAGAAATIVVVTPNSEWTDAGRTVRKGDRLYFTTTGTVHWRATDRTTTPDGDRGVPGWSVGPGGIRGRIGDGKPFDLGARTTLFADRHIRGPRHEHPPPPITMQTDGRLYLGFKNFTPGPNTGMFEVTIRAAVPVAR